MTSRMDRYKEEKVDIGSRTTKNQQLYKDLYSNKMYTEFTETVGDNVMDLTAAREASRKKRRSDYNRAKLFYQDNPNEFDDNANLNINRSYQRILEEENKEKNYNINDIMEFARKNRTLAGEEEKKKRRKSVEYNILSDLSQEKLKEYRARKEKGLTEDEEENLEELINTITTKKFSKKAEDSLLEDLLPQDENETIISTKLLDEIEEGKLDEIDDDTMEQPENTADLEKGLDKSFYTRSMDLKKEDLVLNNDEYDDDYLNEKKKNPLKIIITIIIIMLLLAIVGYIALKVI